MLQFLNKISFKEILIVALVVWSVMAAIWWLFTAGNEIFTDDTRTGAAAARGVRIDAQPATEAAQTRPEGGSRVDPSLTEPSPAQGEDVVRNRPAGPYTLQVGAFKSAQGARGWLSRLTARGYSAYMQPSASEGSEVFRVYVGSFSGESEAAETRSRLQKDGFNSFLRKID